MLPLVASVVDYFDDREITVRGGFACAPAVLRARACTRILWGRQSSWHIPIQSPEPAAAIRLGIHDARGRLGGADFFDESARIPVMDCPGRVVKGGIMARRNGAQDVSILIGARIESLRHERGLSLRSLAEMADCSITTLSRMESGLSSIKVPTIHKIAAALRVRPFDLLNYAPEDDDAGYIVERMRRDSAVFVRVKALLRT